MAITIFLFLLLTYAVRAYQRPWLWAGLFGASMCVYIQLTTTPPVLMLLGITLGYCTLALIYSLIMHKLLTLYHIPPITYWCIALIIAALIGVV